MVTAIVLIEAKPDRVQTAAEQIAETDGVAEVYSVAGRYDLVAVIRASRLEDLETIVPGALDKVEGIVSSETMVAFRHYSNAELDAAYELGLE